MGDYQINSGFITDQTDYRLASAGIAYEVEKARVHHVKSTDIRKQINQLQYDRQFPKNLDYIDSFYDEKSGLSGVAFKDTKTNKVTVGFAGTNLKADAIQDIWADAKIAIDAYSADASYFNEGHAFLNRLSEHYDIQDVTGHSKGGRDAMVLGMAHQIPNITTYNAAPLSNMTGTILIDDFKTIPSAVLNMLKTKLSEYHYQGKMTHYITTNDPLNSIARYFKSIYPGETIQIETGSDSLLEGHDLENFSSGQGGLNYRLMMIDAQKDILTADGGGLTSAQEIYLDANQALAIVASFSSDIQSKQQELEKTYQKWETHIKENWQKIQKKSHQIGKHLSQGEEQSALSSVGCTKATMETDPLQKLNEKRSKIKAIKLECDQLISQYKETIQHQVESDQELSRMFG